MNPPKVNEYDYINFLMATLIQSKKLLGSEQEIFRQALKCNMPIIWLFPYSIAEIPQITAINCLAISFGAVIGALSRYYLTLWFSERLGSSFPYGTFVINISGSLLMGFFTTLFLRQVITSADFRLMIATGILGSYTTFSTYALDTSVLLRTRNHRASLLYWGGSAVLGLAGLWIGELLASRLPF